MCSCTHQQIGQAWGVHVKASPQASTRAVCCLRTSGSAEAINLIVRSSPARAGLLLLSRMAQAVAAACCQAAAAATCIVLGNWCM